MGRTIAIFVLCVALLPGCSLLGSKAKAGVKGKTGEIVLVMPDYPASSTQYRINTFKKYASQFEEANPGVKVTIETLPSQTYQRDIAARLDAGKQTDLIFGPYYPLLTAQGRFANLLPYFKKDNMATSDLYEPLTAITTTANGQLIGIPMSPAPYAVFYNKDWFDKAGVPYPGGDWTWEQYFDISVKLKAANAVANKEVYGSTLPFESTFLETIAQSSGNSILSPDNAKVSGYLDSRPVAEALALLVNHMSANDAVKKVNSSQNPTLIEMVQGNVGMAVSPYINYPFVEKNPATTGKFMIASLPRLEKGKKVNSVLINTLYLAATSKQKELSWTFIKDVILNPDSPFQKDWSKQELLTSKSAVQKLGLNTDPVTKVFIDELNYAVKPITYRNPALAPLITPQNFEPLLEASSTAEMQSALRNAATQIDQKLALAAQKN